MEVLLEKLCRNIKFVKQFEKFSRADLLNSKAIVAVKILLLATAITIFPSLFRKIWFCQHHVKAVLKFLKLPNFQLIKPVLPTCNPRHYIIHINIFVGGLKKIRTQFFYRADKIKLASVYTQSF